MTVLRPSSGHTLQSRHVFNTGPFDIAGITPISLPCELMDEALPISLPLAGPWWAEGTVLRAASAYQQATGRHTRLAMDPN